LRANIGWVIDHPVCEKVIIIMVFNYISLTFVQLVVFDVVTSQQMHALDVIDLTLCCIFILKVSLKAFAFGRFYFLEPLNAVDILCVLLAFFLSLGSLTIEDDLVDRIARMRGVLRIFRLLHVYNQFQEEFALGLAKKKQGGVLRSAFGEGP